jgi:hypothetical protein
MIEKKVGKYNFYKTKDNKERKMVDIEHIFEYMSIKNKKKV